MVTPDQVDVWVGLAVGKEFHHMMVLDDAGGALFDRRVTNREPDLVDRPVTYAIEATSARPPSGYVIGTQEVSGISSIRARIEGLTPTVIENFVPSRSRVSISLRDQNPESARTRISPAAPARRTRATSSSTKRPVPFRDEPLRRRAWRISAVSARVASNG